MFVDQVKIYVKSGRGGDGAVSFRREKYVPNGGPDGGDGGKGGSIIFVVEPGINTLSDFRHKKHYKAQSGEPGGKNRKHGKSADDLIIKVPPGTIIKEAESEKVIMDLTKIDDKEVLLKGGKGGKGNQHYATATMQIPKYAQRGQDGKELWIILELKVIADVGLVGFPNVGKSTFLSMVTNAKPKIANYHFTTINPNLGVVDNNYGGKGFVIADIPGLIEGASAGIGLGHEFLKHIERTRLILHVVDAAGLEGRDPIEDIEQINKELSLFNEKLLERKQVIAANKVDLMEAEENIKRLKQHYEPKDIKVFPISAATGKGLRELILYISSMLDTIEEEPVIFEQEYFVDEENIIEKPQIIVEQLEDGVYNVEGDPIEKMLGYTNLETEKGFAFFQKFLREKGIIDKLEEMGIEEGETVKIYNLEFDYYR